MRIPRKDITKRLNPPGRMAAALAIAIRKLRHPVLASASAVVLAACGDMHAPLVHIKGDTRIEFIWNAERWEPLGYHEPEGYHVEWRRSGLTEPPGQYETFGRTFIVPLDYGFHEIIGHNNDNANVAFRPATDRSSFTASCTTDRYAVPLPDTLALFSPILQAPDQVFAYRHPAREVTDRREDYDFDPSTGLYTFRMPVEPTPRTFFYRIEVELVHNRGRVSGSGGVTIDGMAAQHDIIAGRNLATTAAHQIALKMQPLDGTRAGGDETDSPDAADLDLLAGEFSSFGIPDGHGAVPNTAHIHLRFRDGGARYASVDLTEAMAEHPQGGTIRVRLDIDSNLPHVNPNGPAGGGGGIQVDVEGWKTRDIHLVI